MEGCAGVGVQGERPLAVYPLASLASTSAKVSPLKAAISAQWRGPRGERLERRVSSHPSLPL